MAKDMSEKKVRAICKSFSQGFIARWQEEWMDLSDLTQEQIDTIHQKLCLTFSMPALLAGSNSANEIDALLIFAKWYFDALSLRVAAPNVLAFLKLNLKVLARASLRDARVAILCRKSFARLVSQDESILGGVIAALREQFNFEYDSNMRVVNYDTPFQYFMRAGGETQSLLLSALAKVYCTHPKHQPAIAALWEEKGFGMIPRKEFFNFLQTARMHHYLPLSMMRRYLKSIDYILPKYRLQGQLRNLLDEINYTLISEVELPQLIDQLYAEKPSMKMRFFSTKAAQVLHKHWRVQNEVFSHHEVERLLMLYVNRHPGDDRFNEMFDGKHRLGKIFRHSNEFVEYMQRINGKQDITFDEDWQEAILGEESIAVDASFDHSSSSSTLRMRNG